MKYHNQQAASQSVNHHSCNSRLESGILVAFKNEATNKNVYILTTEYFSIF